MLRVLGVDRFRLIIVPRYKITIAYDGADFGGWQLQDSSCTIQGALEQALFPFEDRRVVVIGAGRTDAGVHAAGQVAAFTLERAADPAALVRALNARLPMTIRVLDASETSESFHPRFDATAKTYCYRIFTDAVVAPFEHRYVWHLPGPLDAEAMRAGAELLVGRHDFAAFQSAGTDVESSERELFESRVEVAGAHEVRYVARGDGFLRHMVRAIIGSLVEVGKGRQSVGWIGDVLASRDRSHAGRTAPPEGLCLLSVEYRAGR